MLRILLLGTPLVFRDDNQIQIQRKLQRALLFYLACQTAPVSRSELMLLFWPDEPDADVRRHLREALSKLRAGLPDPDLMLIDREQVRLDHRRVWVDALELRAVTQRVWNQLRLIPLNTPLPDAVVADMERAINLWHGEHFLGGASLPSTVPFDRWLDSLTDELDYIRQQMLERLGYHHAAGGDLEGGVNYLRMALKNDELNEALHLQVLTWLRAAGKRTDTLNYCEHLKALFMEETGQSLPPGLESLCQKVQASDAGGHPTPSQVWPVYPDLNVPFVGRADLLRTLQRAFQRGGTVLVSGETGVGKTRLVRQLFLSLQPEPRLLLAPARSAERNLPFQPVIDLLRNSILQEEWQQLADVWAGPLTWILPELLALRPELQIPAYDMEAARSRIFEALHQLLLQITQERRVLFFLDDAQWSDDSTLSVLAYLQNHDFFNQHGLLVLAARPEEESSELAEFLDRVQRQTSMEQYQLTELRAEEVAELCRFVLGQAPTPRLLDRLVKEAGGNPLFLLETLRALLDSLPDPASIHWVEELPPANGISNLVRVRLRSLSARARQTLEAAAVCGSAFTPGLLEQVLNTTPEQTANDLEELERRRLIRPLSDGGTSTGYCFIHDVFRERLLNELTPARRRLLHMRVAQALEDPSNSMAEGGSAILADHYQAAGMTARACQYWILAAEYARRLFSRAEAISAYHRAEDLLRHDRAAIPDECILRIYNGLGDLHLESIDADAMLNTYTILLHYGEQRNSPLLIGSAYSGRAHAHFSKSDLNAAGEEIEYGIRYLTLAGHHEELMKAYLHRGMVWHLLLRLEEAAAEYEHVVEMGHGLFGAPITRIAAMALDRLALLHHATGWPWKTIETCEHSLRHSRVLGFTNDSIPTYTAFAMASYSLGEYEAALKYARKGMDQARANDRWRFSGHLHKVFARVLLRQGKLDDCWEHIERMEEIVRRYAPVEMQGDIYSVQGDFFMALGNLADAERVFQAAEQEEHKPDNLSTQYLRLYLALLRGLQGDASGGLSMTGDIIATTGHSGYGRIAVPAVMMKGVLLRLSGDLAQARVDLERALAEAGARGLSIIQSYSEVELGYLNLSEGNSAGAQALAGKVIRTASAMGDRLTELSGLRLAVAAANQQGITAGAVRKRMAEILSEIDSQARSEAVRPHFDHFRARQTENIFW